MLLIIQSKIVYILLVLTIWYSNNITTHNYIEHTYVTLTKNIPNKRECIKLGNDDVKTFTKKFSNTNLDHLNIIEYKCLSNIDLIKPIKYYNNDNKK